MKTQIRLVLCWILAMFLTWLPLVAPAGLSQSAVVNNNCHAVSATSSPVEIAGVIYDSAEASLDTKHNCCGHCNDGCMSNDMATCNQSVSHVSSFIIPDQIFLHDVLLTLYDAEYSNQYHSQIIPPEFRPPVF